MTLAEFLLARIAEDENEIEEAYGLECENVFSKERMLTECRVKAGIVWHCVWILDSFDGKPDALWHDVTRRERSHADSILTDLALPYWKHPDYRQEWKP